MDRQSILHPLDDEDIEQYLKDNPDARVRLVSAEEANRKGLSPKTIAMPFADTVRPDKYAPCNCGSGKKFKFCCFGRFVAVLLLIFDLGCIPFY